MSVLKLLSIGNANSKRIGESAEIWYVFVDMSPEAGCVIKYINDALRWNSLCVCFDSFCLPRA